MRRFFTSMCCAMAVAFAFTSCSDEKTTVTPEISVRPTSVTFTSAGEIKSVAVTTNVDSWTYVCDVEWLTITKGEGELVIVAEANTALEPRNTTITLNADYATCAIQVTQEKGSKYPGYTELAYADALYMGTLYKMFMPDCEGANSIIEMATEDERVSIYIEFFTEAFETIEDVEIVEGTYELGDTYSSFSEMALQGTPMTYIGGGTYVISDEEGDEEFSGGTMISFTVGDITEDVYVVDGTFTISANEDGTYLVKTNFVDVEGNEYKYYYEGEIVYDAEDAIFPNADRQDPSEIVSATLYYMGESGFGTTAMNLSLESSTGAITNVNYYIPTTTFDVITDLSTILSTPEGDNNGAAGTMDKGSMMEMEGFSFPMGTYIMFGFNDYFVADGSSMVMITKDEGADTYTVMANLADVTEANYLLMGSGLSIELYDGTAYEEEEYID